MTQLTPKRDLTFWQNLWRQSRLAWRLLWDPETPLPLKLLPAGAILYWLFPLEGLALPFLATPVDDWALLVLGLRTFIQLTPPYLVQKHLEIIDGRVIEG